MGALVYRWGQELREMANVIRLYSKAERPTFEQLKAIDMTVLTPTGMTLLQRPKAFVLNDHTGFFLSEIVRKTTDDADSNGWNSYHASVSRNPNPRAGGGLPYLPGPPLTAAEKRVAGSSAPKNAAGVKMRRGPNSHSGFSADNCPHSHEVYSNYDTLTLPLEMA